MSISFELDTFVELTELEAAQNIFYSVVVAMHEFCGESAT